MYLIFTLSLKIISHHLSLAFIIITGRMGTVEDVAHSVAYLCENEWTTGTILTVDGGMTSRSNMPFRPKPPKPEAIAAKVNGHTEEVVDKVCVGATFEN